MLTLVGGAELHRQDGWKAWNNWSGLVLVAALSALGGCGDSREPDTGGAQDSSASTAVPGGSSMAPANLPGGSSMPPAAPDAAVVADSHGEEILDEAAMMETAVDEARAAAQQFIQALADPQPTRTGYSVKIPVHDGDRAEHFWVLGVRFENGQFVGEIGNQPEVVANVKIGDEIRASADQIGDWMYLDNRHLVGGWTIRVHRDLMPLAERVKFERSLPYIID